MAASCSSFGMGLYGSPPDDPFIESITQTESCTHIKFRPIVVIDEPHECAVIQRLSEAYRALD